MVAWALPGSEAIQRQQHEGDCLDDLVGCLETRNKSIVLSV